MNRKLVSAIAMICVVIPMLSISSKAQTAQTNDDNFNDIIFIISDGSVVHTTNIQTADNITYVFTANINESIIVGRNNIIIDGNGFVLQGPSGYGRGIELAYTTNVTIKNTQIKNFFTGIYLSYSSNEMIYGNNITVNNWEGITLGSSSNNTISGNTITNNTNTGIGIYSSSSNNTICGNNIADNPNGIWLDLPSNISVFDNNIAHNKIGLWLTYSPNDSIYHNNFLNNRVQVYLDGWETINAWDNGYPSGGNYWSDYNGTDANHDGIGDTPYVIDANNIDHYPLMAMTVPEFPSFIILSPLMITTLLALAIYKGKHWRLAVQKAQKS